MSIQAQRIMLDGKVFHRGDDMLKTMLETQRRFHLRVNGHSLPFQKTDEELLVKTARNIMMEGAELMNSLNWKEWKKTKVEPDWEQVRYEIADIMAFLMNACIEAGMTHEDLFNYYMRKAELNVKRQDEGY